MNGWWSLAALLLWACLPGPALAGRNVVVLRSQRQVREFAASRLTNLPGGFLPAFQDLARCRFRAHGELRLERVQGKWRLAPPQVLRDPQAAEPTLRQAFDAGAPDRPGLPDTAVELEIPTLSQATRILTTQDGTLGSLLSGRMLPEPLADGLSRLDRSLVDSLPFQPLKHRLKLGLLRHASTFKTSGFFDDRRVAGVLTADRLTLDFPTMTPFLGKTYPPGRHQVDVSPALMPRVEYRSREDVDKLEGVELHFRSNQPAGEVSNDAWRLLGGLSLPRVGQHVHIVAPLPLRSLEKEPQLQAARMGDFYRRANLAAEMITIVEGGRGISFNRGNWGCNFGALTRWKLQAVTDYLLSAGLGADYRIGDAFKMAWVGFRGRDKYDQPGLYGLEYRAIHRTTPPDTARRVLNALQRRMLGDDYGLPADLMRRWLKAKGSEATQAVGAAWYGGLWHQLFDEAPRVLRRALTARVRRSLGGRGEEKRLEIKMLAYDWSDDPLLFEDGQALRRVMTTQRRALGLLLDAGPAKRLMRRFLWRSGLYRRVLKSIGLRGELPGWDRP